MGFSQLVSQPTTDSGSLLDYIYLNRRGHNETNEVITDVRDTYYSDHDAVFCSTTF